MILTAYIDEAGTHGGSPVTVMGAYVARLGQWKHFDQKWNRLLKHYNLEYFHSQEMLQAKGQFRRGWDHKRALEAVQKSNKIIDKHTMFGVSTFVNDRDYNSFYVTGEKPRKIPLDTPYGLCFRLMIIIVTKKVKDEEQINDPHINFVLESGAKNAGDAVRIFDLFKKEAPQRDILGAISFGKKREFPGLQAADSVASPVFQFEKKPPEEPIYAPDDVFDEPIASARKRRNGEAPVYRVEATEKVLRDFRASIDESIKARRKYGLQRSKQA